MLSFAWHKIIYNYNMAKKGKEKNTNNKAKHSKLIAQKNSKKKSKTAERKARLRAIFEKSKGAQES